MSSRGGVWGGAKPKGFPLFPALTMASPDTIILLVTGRMPRSGKLQVLILLTGQKSGFSPRRGDSLHRFTSSRAEGHVGLLASAKFHRNRCRGVGMLPKKYQKFPLFGKESPRRGDSLDRFQTF